MQDDVPNTEKELLRAARDGSETALEELYTLFGAPLTAHLNRLVGKRLARIVPVADLCQECFADSFNSLSRLSPDAGLDDFRRLLNRHARWLVGKAAAKHQGFAGESVVGQPLEHARLDPAGDKSVGPVTRRDEDDWLSRQIDRLGTEDARILRLRLRGTGFDDIAQELDIEVDAARKRYLRASVRLREQAKG